MSSKGAVLVTGAAGYIGTHACVQLIEAGYQVVGLDNLSNSSSVAIDRVNEITGTTFPFYEVDLRSPQDIEHVLRSHDISAVMHFAGLKSVAESVERPLEYYENNVAGSENLIAAMDQVGTRKLVFSSTAAIYGVPEHNPIDELASIKPVSPYGSTKAAVEKMLANTCNASSTWNITALRYFNPVGAHISGLIGESPVGTPNNLMPYITQVAAGKRDSLTVYGDDYATHDGTGVRDYIHVEDLVAGHIKALICMSNGSGFKAYNLGTGKGCSVLVMVKSFEAATGITIPYKIAPRRLGDVDECYANPGLAAQELNWRARRSIADMCRDAWAWQNKNPWGYKNNGYR